MPRRLALATFAWSLTLAPGLASRAAAPGPAFPSPVPHATVSQWLGITNIAVNYFSPAVAGRRVRGDVIKSDVPWLMGEGAAPTVTCDRDIVLGGAAIPAGTYSLVAIPSDGDWTIIVNRQTRLWRAVDRDPALDVGRFKAQVESAPRRERLTFVFADFTDDQATLNLEWDEIRVRLPIVLHTAEQVRAEMQALDGTWRSYADAARYWLEKKTDLDTGLKYANWSLVLQETWYNTWIKALLLAAKGDYPNAHASAERTYQLGRAAGADFTLEPTVRESLAAWSSQPAPPPPPAALPLARPVRGDRARKPRRGLRPVAQASNVPTEATMAGEDLGAEPLPASLERPVNLRRSPSVRAPSASAFSPVIRRGQRDLQRCYQRALRQDPTLSTARVTVSIGVGTSGRVTKVAVAPPLPSGEFDSCLREAVGRWLFPASPVEYETQVPLALNGRL